MNSMRSGDLAFTRALGTSVTVRSRLDDLSNELKFKLPGIEQMVIDIVNAWMWDFPTIGESDPRNHLVCSTDFFIDINSGQKTLDTP